MSKQTMRTRPSRALAFALILIAALLSGCSPEIEKSEFAGPDWSRGIHLGSSGINNRPGVVWDAEANSALVVWLSQIGNGWQFQFARVDDQGQASPVITLPFVMRYPTRPQFVRDSAGGLHLFWLDSGSESQLGLYHARMSGDGSVLSDPQRLSDTGSAVDGYSVVEVIPGSLDIFASDSSGGTSLLFHARMENSGAFVVQPHPLSVGGDNPNSAVDSAGMVHLAWSQTQGLGAQQIMYAEFDPVSQQLREAVVLAAFPVGTGLSLYAPEIALETGRVYVMWALEQRGGGLSPGTAQTYYRSFPTGHPEQASGDRLELPTFARPDYDVASGALNYQALFSLTDPATGQPAPIVPAEYTYMQYAIQGQRDEAAFLVSSFMALPRRPAKAQIAFVVFDEGNPKGYEVAARTATGSLRPIAAVDDEGGIHLAWLSLGGFGNYDIHYASTAASVRTALNRITWEDVGAAIMGRTWTTAAALSFFPILVIWLLLPFAWLVGFYLFRPDSDLSMRSGRVALIVAIALYLLSKFFVMPAFLWYAPFMDLVPASLEYIVLLGVPAVIMGLALLAMRAYIRRSERKAVLFAFAIFAGIDSVLSLALYIPNAIGG